LRHLGDPASFPLWLHGDPYLAVLEPVGHVPLHRAIVELDDLGVDIELDALPINGTTGQDTSFATCFAL